MPVARAGAATSVITITHNQLLRNGLPWVPRGVQIVGLVAPDGALSGKYVAAHQQFGYAELQAAVAAHADLVRFQVSQFGLDPAGPAVLRRPTSTRWPTPSRPRAGWGWR